MYLHTRELHFVVFVTVMVDEFKSCCNLQAVWAKAWDSSALPECSETRF